MRQQNMLDGNRHEDPDYWVTDGTYSIDYTAGKLTLFFDTKVVAGSGYI